MSEFALEGLEDRRLLSGGHAHHSVRRAVTSTALHATKNVIRKATTTTTSTGASETTIQFSAAPAAVQTGLQALVPSSITIAATQNVEVDTSSTGVVTYEAHIDATGFRGTITVDATGAAVTETGGDGEHGHGDHGDRGGYNVTTLQFSAVPSVVATQLQSQVDAGVTIPATQTVYQFTTDSGKIIYAAQVNNNGVIAGYQFNISPSAPGILTDGNGVILPTSTAAPGALATLYVTGTGEVNDVNLESGFAPATGTTTANLPRPVLPLSVTVGGTQALVQFFGSTPGVIGMTQVNIIVPSSAAVGSQPVVVTAGGIASPAVNITVTTAPAKP